MRKSVWATLAALMLAGCGNEIRYQVPHEVQEGHGGDGLAAVLVDSARAALMQLGLRSRTSEENAALNRLESTIGAATIHTTDHFDDYDGPIAELGPIRARLTHSPRGQQPVLLFDRQSLLAVVSAGDRQAVQRLAGPTLRAYLLIDTQDAGRAEWQNYDLTMIPPASIEPAGTSWPEIGKSIVGHLLDSQLILCSGFEWLRQLFVTVPVEPTDAELRDRSTGFPVDAIVLEDGKGGWQIRYNRARLKALPNGMPLALLVLHEYLRALRPGVVAADDNYTLSSDLAHEASFRAAPLPGLVNGTLLVYPLYNKLCRKLARINRMSR